jgi:hypothetical protein
MLATRSCPEATSVADLPVAMAPGYGMMSVTLASSGGISFCIPREHPCTARAAHDKTIVRQKHVVPHNRVLTC